MIDKNCEMGDIGCNVHGKLDCRLCSPDGDISSPYVACKWKCTSAGCVADASGNFLSESECKSYCNSYKSQDCIKDLERKCGKNRICDNTNTRNSLRNCIYHTKNYNSRGKYRVPYTCVNNNVVNENAINHYINSICPEPDIRQCNCNNNCMIDYSCMGEQGCNKNGVMYCRDCGFGRNPKCRWKCSTSMGKCIPDASGTFTTKKACENECATCWPNCKWSCESTGNCRLSGRGMFDDKSSCLLNCSKCLGQMESFCGHLPCSSTEEFEKKRMCVLDKINPDNNYLECRSANEFSDNLRTYLRGSCDDNIGWCTCQMLGSQAPIPYPNNTCVSVHEEGGNIVYMPHYLLECTGHKDNKSGCINSPANCRWHDII